MQQIARDDYELADALVKRGSCPDFGTYKTVGGDSESAGGSDTQNRGAKGTQGLTGDETT